MSDFAVPEHVRPIRDKVLAFMIEKVEPAEAALHSGGDDVAEQMKDLQNQAKAEGL